MNSFISFCVMKAVSLDMETTLQGTRWKIDSNTGKVGKETAGQEEKTMTMKRENRRKERGF